MARIAPAEDLCYKMVAEDLTGAWSGRVGAHSLVSERKENQDRLICVVGANERFVPAHSEPLDPNSVLTIGVLDGHGRHGSWVPEIVVESFTKSLLSDVEPPDSQVEDEGDSFDGSSRGDASPHAAPPVPNSLAIETQPAKETTNKTTDSAKPGENTEIEETNNDKITEERPTTEPNLVELQHKLMYNRAHKCIECQNGSGTQRNGRYSGTTATLLSVTPHTFTISNVGDTEAVLGRINTNTSDNDGEELEAHEITTSHRPGLIEERERVEAAGGVVEAQRNRDGSQGTGPIRIWLKDVRTPGLMVSRSLGDVVAHKKLGVIADPWVLSQTYDVNTDLNLIVASDGVWDVVGYDEAVRFLDLHDSPSEAAFNLATLAVSRQRPRHHDNATVVAIFLDSIEARKSRIARLYPNAKELIRTAMTSSVDENAGTFDDGLNHHTHVEATGSTAESCMGSTVSGARQGSQITKPILSATRKESVGNVKKSSMCTIS